MNFNTILYRLGIDPSNFRNEDNESIKTDTGFIYEVTQVIGERKCPFCGDGNCVINDHDFIEINCSETDQIKDTLRIKKVRLKCKSCGKTFTPPIRGIERYNKTSNQTIEMIINDFTKLMTFSDIAKRYGLTTSRVIQLFDDKIKHVPRRSLPKVLCVDEIRFSVELNQKYVCVLYDFEKREIVDIIRNRQLGYLDEYFEKIDEKERNYVKYFVSDMYDGYSTIRKRYFKNALHIIDLFHVITQLTTVVNSIRVDTMKTIRKGSIEYSFMKRYWKSFLCRKERIPDRFFNHKSTAKQYHFDDMVHRCIITNIDLLESYNYLQDLFHYNQKYNFYEALDFIDYMSKRLIESNNEKLNSVGYTYKKWSIEIANGLARTQSGIHYTNGIAESINNHLKTIIKCAYGYHNFDRFRRRAMMIITYKKDLTSR